MAKYFISYTWAKGGTGGSGCTDVEIDGIRNWHDINAIIETIQENHPELGNLSIVNWKKYEGQEENDGEK